MMKSKSGTGQLSAVGEGQEETRSGGHQEKWTLSREVRGASPPWPLGGSQMEGQPGRA